MTNPYYNNFTEDEIKTEAWKPAVGFEATHEVSNLGRVRRSADAPRTRYKKGQFNYGEIDQHGYQRVQLQHKGRRYRRGMHGLVVLAFLGQCPPDKEEINHIDNNPLNNRLNNLEWVTKSENQRHSFATTDKRQGDRHHSRVHPENLARGNRHGMCKLSERDVLIIKQLISQKLPLVKIARRFQVATTTICDIKHKRSRVNG